MSCNAFYKLQVICEKKLSCRHVAYLRFAWLQLSYTLHLVDLRGVKLLIGMSDDFLKMQVAKK